MKDLEWKDEYLLGIPAIDFQHRRIFDCILSIARGSTADDRLRAEAEIIKLLDLLQAHFSLEESMMQTLRYPDLELHIEEHRQFHAEVHDLAQKSLRSKAGVSREAVRMTHKWLTDHIMASDRHYLDFFANPKHKSIARKRAAN